mmetsp:Transcript_106692/g.318959  ORF Transcript_106692/g.318959 Transcript_106692/m.318959 type:complete len:323 (+) Transcript_106692:274-1242(+)
MSPAATSPAASERSPTTSGRCTRQRKSRAQSPGRRGSRGKATTLCAPRAWKVACRAPNTSTTFSVRSRISVMTFLSSSTVVGSSSRESRPSTMTRTLRLPDSSRRSPWTTRVRRNRASVMGEKMSSAISVVSQSVTQPATTRVTALARALRNRISGHALAGRSEAMPHEPSKPPKSPTRSSSDRARCTVRPSKRRPGAPAKRASSARSADLPTCAGPHTATHRRADPRCCISSHRSLARPQKSSTFLGSSAEHTAKAEGPEDASRVAARRSKRIAEWEASPIGSSMYFSASPRKPTCGTVWISYLAMSKACPTLFEPVQKAW